MGSLFSPKVQPAPPPPEPKDYNVEDRISGTKQNIVTQPDGSKLVVIEKNLTPEQQEIEDNLKRLAEDSLAKYESLVNDPFLDTMPEYRDQVQRVYDTQFRNLNDAYNQAARSTEQTANRFGVDDSTAATQLRAQNTRNLAGAQQQLADDKINTINAVRQQEMQNQLGVYGLASGRQDTLLSQGLQSLGLGNSIALANAGRNDNYQNALWQTNLANTQARNAAAAQGMQTFGQLAGIGLGLATGGLGFGAAGGLGFGATGSSLGGGLAASMAKRW